MSRLVLVALFPSVLGHSYLANPASRNLLAKLAGKEDCPHCLQSGGPDNVKERGAGVWPSREAPGSHGLCGDPVQGQANPERLADETYLKEGPVVATYRPGEVVEFHIVVSTHHRGHYEFRICDRALDGTRLTSAAEGQACLDAHLLERAAPMEDCVVNDPRGDCQPVDPKHPERWYLPPPGTQTQQAGPNFTDDMAPQYPVANEVHVMRYNIPADLRCSSCTLQWYWSSGNSCYYDGDYFDYYELLDTLGWAVADRQPQISEPWANCDTKCCKTGGSFGEEFWNCADIAVLDDGTTHSMTTTTTSAQLTSTTTTADGLIWEPVEGGLGRACRGSNSRDNSANYFAVHFGVASIDDCKTKCISTTGCVGIEYNDGGRCEVWTRADGIRASVAVAGFTCLRYGSLPSTTTLAMGPFEPVDGGEGRACRGANSADNAVGHYTAHSGVFSLSDCKARCASTAGCVGIEYNNGGRCEVWTRADGIRASVAVAGFTCLRYGSLPSTTTLAMGPFEPVDGGEGRVCRGANSGDNAASYYTVHTGVNSLSNCKARCASTAGCVGLEHKGSRCEVWTRADGIQASAAAAGYTCLRYLGEVTTTTAGLACSASWAKCGGDGWTGPTCCVAGYQCEAESRWYSQCRPESLLLESASAKRKRSRQQRFLGTALLQGGSGIQREMQSAAKVVLEL